jgi:hypothetical protein
MHWSAWKVWIAPAALSIALVAVIAGLSTTAHAQPPYPPVAPSVVTGEVRETTPAVGESTDVCCTVLDENADPIEGATCTFIIVSQPGTDATLDTTTGVTDVQGKACAVLSAGSTPGEITVEVESGGITSQIQATVGEEEAPEEEIVIAPPPTGGGPGGGDNWGGWLTGISSVLAAAALALLAWRVYTGRSRSA